jgi:hypothetical protein
MNQSQNSNCLTLYRINNSKTKMFHNSLTRFQTIDAIVCFAEQEWTASDKL